MVPLNLTCIHCLRQSFFKIYSLQSLKPFLVYRVLLHSWIYEIGQVVIGLLHALRDIMISYLKIMFFRAGLNQLKVRLY